MTIYDLLYMIINTFNKAVLNIIVGNNPVVNYLLIEITLYFKMLEGHELYLLD